MKDNFAVNSSNAEGEGKAQLKEKEVKNQEGNKTKFDQDERAGPSESRGRTTQKCHPRKSAINVVFIDHDRQFRICPK